MCVEFIMQVKWLEQQSDQVRVHRGMEDQLFTDPMWADMWYLVSLEYIFWATMQSFSANRHCGLAESVRTWDGTGFEFESW